MPKLMTPWPSTPWPSLGVGAASVGTISGSTRGVITSAKRVGASASARTGAGRGKAVVSEDTPAVASAARPNRAMSGLFPSAQACHVARSSAEVASVSPAGRDGLAIPGPIGRSFFSFFSHSSRADEVGGSSAGDGGVERRRHTSTISRPVGLSFAFRRSTRPNASRRLRLRCTVPTHRPMRSAMDGSDGQHASEARAQ